MDWLIMDGQKKILKRYIMNQYQIHIITEIVKISLLKLLKLQVQKKIKESDRIRSFSKTCIPGDIIDSIEDNENCINLEERIPIIGTVTIIIKIFTTKD